MSLSGADRVKLMESLGIIVMDSTSGDNLYLGKDNIFIPYNIMNFMLSDEEHLVNDVLKRFRERQMNDPVQRMEDWWNIARREIELEQMLENKEVENPLIEKKQNIRNILMDKGLLCSDIE